MAYYAALVSLVQLLEDIIHNDRYQNILLDVQQKSASIYGKFSLLQTLLDDYSPKYRKSTDFLERRIKDAAYQTQDIIESHISNQVRRKDKTHGVKSVLQRFISALQKAVLRLLQPQRCEELRLDNVEKEYQELKKVKEEVDCIIEELMKIEKSHTTEDLQLSHYFADAGTSEQAPSHRNSMEGVEELLMTIKGQLCGEPSKLQVVSVVGMGGIGKTTLARNIIDDELIVYKFDCRAWVTISQDYYLQKILLDFLDSMNVPTNKLSGVGELGEKIYKHLKGMRYLIIMDDMWDTKVWDDMKRILPDDSNGSRIIITTRISDVALYANRFGFYHQIQFLNEDQSWNLFCEKVVCPPELQDLGRLIAKNCRGLPLAIIVVAGLLSKVNKKRFDWEQIARNISSTAAENDEHFSKILSLSYNHLPHHLKPCLLYIASFPEDYEIRVSKLVKLWIAEGFLKPIESKSLEAVAEEYLEDLVNRNLVLITKKRSNGKIKCCSIHDLLRDLCIGVICYENFLHVVRPNHCFDPATAMNARRLYIRGDFPSRSQFTKAKEFDSCVRSVISDALGWNFLFLGLDFKLLRVLDTKGHQPGFPTRILELFHLRYLAFTEFHIVNIPPSISLLQNLQTLIIKFRSWRSTVCSLPYEIREMPNLRHIMSSRGLHFECQFFEEFEERIVGEPSILESLQTLSSVKDVRFTNEVIEMIPNLHKLKVWCFEKEATVWQKFRIDNLVHLCQLESLGIYFITSQSRKVNPLPESFAFPLTLKKLSLSGCKLPWKDMTVVGSLPNLQVLKLRNSAFVGTKWEPVEGEFPKMKFLLLEGLELMYWQVENIHFPTLQHLKISCCRQLHEIPLEIGEISTLELVEVNFSESAAKSALKMLEEQRDMGNDILQVRVDLQYRKFREEEALESEEEIQEEASDTEKEI